MLPVFQEDLAARSREFLARRYQDGWAGSNIGVLGMGRVGTSVARLLQCRGANVFVHDDAKPEQDYPAWTGASPSLDAVLASPGIPWSHRLLQTHIDNGGVVFGELGLSSWMDEALALVTGTNGKSTTTALLGALLGRRTFAGGNLGTPMADYLYSLEFLDRGFGASVFEVSSFQLEAAYDLDAATAVLLQITPDHLDRYQDFDEYRRVKQRVLSVTEGRGWGVLCEADSWASTKPENRERCVWVGQEGAQVPFDAQHYLVFGEDAIQDARGVVAELGGFALEHPVLRGRHGRLNACMALAAARTMRVNALDLKERLDDFEGLPHRYQRVGRIGEREWINDSKATNDAAAAEAIRAAGKGALILMGGVDKGGGYEASRDALLHTGAKVIVFGEARSVLSEELAGAVMESVATMREAMVRANEARTGGGPVVLAPACSSFDEFTNYAKRGEAFGAFVQSHREEESPHA